MLLAIDTSTSRRGSVAVVSNGVVHAYREIEPRTVSGVPETPGPRKDGGRAAASLEQGSLAVAVAEAVPDLSIIERYAVSIGPGSFTGLRIALAFLKGMALVHPRPVIPVSTLAVLAKRLFSADPDAQLALPMLDARRNEAYAALYTRDLELDPALEEAAHSVPAIAARVKSRAQVRIIAGGDGLSLDHGADVPWVSASRELWTPDARVLGSIALARLDAGVDAASLEPAYLQLAPAEVPTLVNQPGRSH